MATVILRPTGDAQRDIRRISRLHGTFISYPGKDRFAFQIFEEGRSHLIEFPNDTTHLCADLLTRIKDAVGENNLRLGTDFVPVTCKSDFGCFYDPNGVGGSIMISCL